MVENSLKWIILTAIITGVVTFIVLFSLNYIQDKRPELNYWTYEAVPFEDSGASFAIYHLVISNNGETTIKNIEGQIILPEGSGLTSKVTSDPAILKYDGQVSENIYSFNFPTMNSGETSIISIMAISKSALPSSPTVSIRGEGVKAVKSLGGQNRNNYWVYLVMLMTALYLVFGYILLRRVKAKEKEMKEFHSADQNLILAYLCGITSLKDEEKKYREITGGLQYWAESDRMAKYAIENSKDREGIEKRKQVLLKLIEYGRVAKESKGLIYYNLARISKVQKNKNDVEKYLKEAETFSPELVKKRIKIERFFV